MENAIVMLTVALVIIGLAHLCVSLMHYYKN